jgi:DNA primase large subunit
VNIYDAAKYGIANNWVKNRVDVESTVTIKIIDEAFEERIKKEVAKNVDDVAINDIEKPGVEIRVDAEKTVQLRILRKPWNTECRRK